MSKPDRQQKYEKQTLFFSEHIAVHNAAEKKKRDKAMSTNWKPVLAKESLSGELQKLVATVLHNGVFEALKCYVMWLYVRFFRRRGRHGMRKDQDQFLEEWK